MVIRPWRRSAGFNSPATGSGEGVVISSGHGLDGF